MSQTLSSSFTDNTLCSLSSAGAENNRDFSVTKEETEGRKIKRDREREQEQQKEKNKRSNRLLMCHVYGCKF